MISKKIPIIVGAVGVPILALIVIVLVQRGVTPKQQYTSCMRDCYDLMILESSKQYCPGRCTEITKWQPTAAEINEVIDKITGKKTAKTNKNTAKNTATANTNTSTANTNTTNTAPTVYTHALNTNAAVDKDGQFYCNWVWPQEIINKDTKDLVQECTFDRPWCFFADYSYDKVGCCKDSAHTDCVTLPNLLGE